MSGAQPRMPLPGRASPSACPPALVAAEAAVACALRGSTAAWPRASGISFACRRRRALIAVSRSSRALDTSRNACIASCGGWRSTTRTAVTATPASSASSVPLQLLADLRLRVPPAAGQELVEWLPGDALARCRFPHRGSP